MFKVLNRTIGKGFKPFIIAEVSANHGGSILRAKDSILAARDLGADAVKIRTYTSDTMAINSDKHENFKETDDTFTKTYAVLINESDSLFVDCIDSLLSGNWVAKKQRGVGTHHYVKDLPSNFFGWGSYIAPEIARLDKEGLRYE